MNVPHRAIKLDVRRAQLINFIEIASASLREVEEEANAIALFRLRTKIREGLSYEEAYPAFFQYTKNLFTGKT